MIKVWIDRPLRVLGSQVVLVGAGLACAAVVLSTGCPGPQDGDGGAAGPAEMRVTRFDVGAGETEMVGSNLKIIAAEGMRIDGDVLVDPSKGGDIELIAETGDIIISGRIIVVNGDSANSKRSLGSGDRSQAVAGVSVAMVGTSVVASALSALSTIELGPGALIQAGNGQDMPDETFAGPASFHEGQSGTDGGSVILAAVGGTVKFLGGKVGVGRGGDGASVDADEVDSAASTIEIIGGRGGKSGELIISAGGIEGQGALSIEDLSAALDAGEDANLFAQPGRGGLGGTVTWNNTFSGKMYENLTNIVVRGGQGGEGLHEGGHGGDASYFSGRVINEIASSVSHVEAFGGAGGDVFGHDLVVIVSGRGGDGGKFGVIGNHGWSGGESSGGMLVRDGANGGNVNCVGGSGGDVLGGLEAVNGFGGRGGSPLPSVGGFPLVVLDVVSGDGGKGMDRCGQQDPEGGDGGNSGNVMVQGGAGGDVDGTVEFAVCGDGGSVGKAWRGRPGDGGHGDPPGKAGTLGSREVVVGEAGHAEDEQSCEAGENLGQAEDVEQGRDGSDCGEDHACGSIFEGGLDVSAVLTEFVGDDVITHTLVSMYSASDDAFMVTIERKFNGEVQSSSSFLSSSAAACFPGFCENPAISANRVHCRDGVLFYPGDGGSWPDGSRTFSVIGCDVARNVYGASCRQNYTCDDNSLTVSSAPCP